MNGSEMRFHPAFTLINVLVTFCLFASVYVKPATVAPTFKKVIPQRRPGAQASAERNESTRPPVVRRDLSEGEQNPERPHVRTHNAPH